jgi:hypothetical protein
MDEQFDRLSRTLAGHVPRRRALTLLAATLAGAVLGLRPAYARQEWDGSCGRKCSPEKNCMEGAPTSGTPVKCRFCRVAEMGGEGTCVGDD